MTVVKNPIARTILFTMGIASVALGVVGAFLPVLPTTPFLLLAAWCFLKSSDKTYQALRRHPILGAPLVNWEENRAITRPAKALALGMITLSLIIMWVKVANPWVKAPVTALLVMVSAFIATRREGR